MTRCCAREQNNFSDRSLKRKKYLEWGISKNIGRAISDYGMIQDGDRILVRLCGKTADLALLKILSDRRAFVPISYEISGGYVDQGGSDQLRDFLAKFCKQCGCSFVVKKIKSLKKLQSNKNIFYQDYFEENDPFFKMAETVGCSKIALSAHKDNAVRVLLENLLFRGNITPLEPVEEFLKNRLAVIRPLVYVERIEIEEWARFNRLLLLGRKTQVSKSRQQSALEKMIDELLESCPSVKTNILRSIKRIKKDYLC
jgi:tRNA 2-thiocytidine biosynthesis protein TtcA